MAGGTGPPERDRLLALLADRTDGAVWSVGPDWGELLFVGDGYVDLWDHSVDALASDPTAFRDAVHADDRAAVDEVRAAATAGQSDEVTCRVERGDRRVELCCDPVVEDGGVERIDVVARDVTQEWRQRRELERYRTIVDSVSDGIYLFDADHRLAYVNDAAVESSPVSRSDMLGETLVDLSTERNTDDFSKEDTAAVAEALASGDRESHRHTRWFETVAGAKPFDVRLARVEGHDGEYLGIVSALRDVSDVVETEQELRAKNEKLDEFASMVSHDLRNPLQVAQGNVELAAEDRESDHLDTVADMLDRMTAIIDDVLTLAREDQVLEDVEAVPLSAAVRRCAQTVTHEAIDIEVTADATVRADRRRLIRILENLLRNAVEHADNATVIRVGTLEERDGFYVADDGDGIPAEERDSVFDPGYSTAQDGTGLGLHIVAELVAAHHWDLRVTESAEGGARFEIVDVELAGGPD
jgi:PAS domain S-box-containing protein